MGADKQFYSFDAQAGRAAVLVLGGATDPAVLDPVVAAFAAHRPALAALQADFLVMLGFAAGFRAWQSGNAAAPIVVCQDDFFSRCGDALVVVTDRAARVVACWPAGSVAPAGLAAAALAAVERVGREPSYDCCLPAPVLAVPGLLDPALCQTLIDGFEAGAHFDSGVSGVDANGHPHHRVDHSKKHRATGCCSRGTVSTSRCSPCCCAAARRRSNAPSSTGEPYRPDPGGAL